jgi:Domain of unknown function (DUF4190)
MRYDDDDNRGTSLSAIASLLFGLMALVCVPINLLPAIPGVLLGAFAIADINRSYGRRGGKGLAVAGLLLCSLAILGGCCGASLDISIATLEDIQEPNVDHPTMYVWILKETVGGKIGKIVALAWIASSAISVFAFAIAMLIWMMSPSARRRSWRVSIAARHFCSAVTIASFVFSRSQTARSSSRVSVRRPASSISANSSTAMT